MAFRHLLLRLTPRLDRRWVVGGLLVGVAAAAVLLIRFQEPAPPMELVALGPEGTFLDTVPIPAEWADSATTTPGAPVRVPLILGVRNLGTRPVAPESLALSLPARYRLTDEEGRELDALEAGAAPLTTYGLATGLEPVQPERLPVLLPAHDTLWLEIVIPSYYCVEVADSIPEFVPAPPPPIETLRHIRIFYAFQGGDLEERRTGTLALRLDSALLEVDIPEDPPTFPMEADPAAAQPELGALRRVGSRRVRCGEPQSPMQLLSTVWAPETGGLFITLDYGGKVRKRLYDLDGDGVVERESWDPAGDGRFTATRRAEYPIPDFLLPPPPDTARGAPATPGGSPPDSLVGPGADPGAGPGPGPAGEPGPLGQPLRGDTLPPPDTGGGGPTGT